MYTPHDVLPDELRTHVSSLPRAEHLANFVIHHFGGPGAASVSQPASVVGGALHNDFKFNFLHHLERGTGLLQLSYWHGPQ